MKTKMINYDVRISSVVYTLLSFPRRRESSAQYMRLRYWSFWMPVFTGMTYRAKSINNALNSYNYDIQKHSGFSLKLFSGILFTGALLLFLSPVFASATEIDRIGLQLIARGCGAKLGLARFVSSQHDLSDEDNLSEWVTDDDGSDFDCARLFLAGVPQRRIKKQIAKRNDFRLCVQTAGKGGKEGREACTPWASEKAGTDGLGRWIPEGGGWSDWARTEDRDNPRRMRIRLQKRPIRRAPGIIIEDARIGIQASDNGCFDIGGPKFTPWLSEGGGWTQWATDANAFSPDCVRVALESRVGFAPPEAEGGADAISPSAPERDDFEAAPSVSTPVPPPAVDLWIQHKGKFYDGTLVVNRGERAALSWAGGDAHSCSLAPSGGVGRSSSQTITAVSSQTYTLTCAGAGGTSKDEVSIIVLEPSELDPSGAAPSSSLPADQKIGQSSEQPFSSPKSSQEKSAAQTQSGAASAQPSGSLPSPSASEPILQTPQDAPVLSQGIRGSHDGAQGVVFFNQCSAFGWATDTDNRSKFVTVRVYADGTLITQGLANQFRSDLKDANVCADGTCAFGISLFEYLRPHTSSVIRVRAVDPETAEEVNLSNTPQKMTCIEPAQTSAPADIFITNVEACGGGVSPQENSQCIDPEVFSENPPGICAYPKRPTLSWNYSHAQDFLQSAYQIQVDNNPDFSSPAMDTEKITGGTESYIVSSGLSWDTGYFWRLRAWDSEDVVSEWKEGTFFVTPPHEAPAVGFSWSPNHPQARATTQFTDQSAVFPGGSVQSRQWTFQDGDPLSADIQDPKTRFASEGSKKVRLAVEDSDGFSCGLEHMISVEVPPHPEFQEVTPR